MTHTLWLGVVTVLLLVVGGGRCGPDPDSPGPMASSQPSSIHHHVSFCSESIARDVMCPAERPNCCLLHKSAVRCCPANETCADCHEHVEGYSIARGSAIVGGMGLLVLLLLTSIITSGVGRHCAWMLERYRVINEYRRKQVLQRQEADAFKRELRETEVRDIEEAEVCVICCARYKDCGLVPCGHVCCCHFCAKRLRGCPVCRRGVEECYRLPIYLVRQLVGVNAATVLAEQSPTNAEEHVGRSATAVNTADDPTPDERHEAGRPPHPPIESLPREPVPLTSVSPHLGARATGERSHAYERLASEVE